MVDMLAQLVQQKDKFLLQDGLLNDEVGVQGRRLLGYAFFSWDLEEMVELFERSLVSHETTVDDELSVLAETHGVGLRFREAGPQLREPGFVVLFQYNGLWHL